MSKDDKFVGQFVTADTVRIGGFPNLDEPVFYDSKTKKTRKPATEAEKANAKYGASLLFPVDSADHKGAMAAAIACAKAKWPGLPLKEIKFPFKSGDKLNAKRADKRNKDGGKEPQDRLEQNGMIVLYARSKYQPKMAYLANGKLVECESEDAIKANLGKFYGGVNAFVELNFVANGDPDNEQFKPNVTAYLNGILSTNKGEKLSGRRSAAETFKGYAGRYSDTDPTEGAETVPADDDDEIPY